MAMNKQEFHQKYTDFMSIHAESLSESIELKLRSKYEILKATGVTGDELMLEMFRYSSFDAVGRAILLTLSIVWELDATLP